MRSGALAGWFLIIGPIVTMGTGLLGPWSSISDFSDTSAVLTVLGQNAAAVGIYGLIAVLGLTLIVAGFSRIRDTMIGGDGENYARLGFLLFLMLIPTALVENGLNSAVAGTAAIPHGAGMATAATLWAASEGVGTFGTVIPLLGLAIFGVGILVQKNYTVIIAIFLITSGLLGVIIPVASGYDSQLMWIVWIAVTISSIATGIMTVRYANAN